MVYKMTKTNKLEKKAQEKRIDKLLDQLAETTNRDPPYKALMEELKDYKKKYGRGYLHRRK